MEQVANRRRGLLLGAGITAIVMSVLMAVAGIIYAFLGDFLGSSIVNAALADPSLTWAEREELYYLFAIYKWVFIGMGIFMVASSIAPFIGGIKITKFYSKIADDSEFKKYEGRLIGWIIVFFLFSSIISPILLIIALTTRNGTAAQTAVAAGSGYASGDYAFTALGDAKTENALKEIADMETKGLLTKTESKAMRDKLLQNLFPASEKPAPSKLEMEIDHLKELKTKGLIDEEEYKKLLIGLAGRM